MSSNPNTLQNFISHVKGVGLPTASYYFVLLPDVSDNKNRNVSESPRVISLLCESLNIPGLNIMSIENRIFGEVTDIPYGINYPPLNLSFLLDHNFSTRKYFEDWSQQVVNRSTRAMGYYDDYVRDIQIFVTDRNGIPVFGLKLHEAWPKNISDQTMSNTSKDIILLNATIAYKYWERYDIDSLGNATLKKYASSGVGSNISVPNFAALNPETFLNATGSPVNAVGSLGAGNSLFGLTGYGDLTATNFSRQGKKTQALLEASGMTAPTEPTFGSKLGGLMGSTGFNMGVFGNTMSQLGTSINGIAGPISAGANAITTVAGTLGSIDSLLSKVGINTGLGKTASNLAQAGGQLAVVSQLNNIPGSLTSIGSNLGAAGTAITSATESIKNLPGATTSITSSLKEMGSLFSMNGSSLSNIGNTL